MAEDVAKVKRHKPHSRTILVRDRSEQVEREVRVGTADVPVQINLEIAHVLLALFYC